MNIGDWQFLSVVAFFAGLLLGAFITVKLIDWKAGEAKKRIRELERLTEFQDDALCGARKLRDDALKAVKEAGRVKEEYRKKWADELQKRLELAELVRKHEKLQVAVAETTENADAEVERGEVSSGD